MLPFHCPGVVTVLTFHSLLQYPLKAAESHIPPGYLWIICQFVPLHAEWNSASISHIKHGHLAQYGCDGTQEEAGHGSQPGIMAQYILQDSAFLIQSSASQAGSGAQYCSNLDKREHFMLTNPMTLNLAFKQTLRALLSVSEKKFEQKICFQTENILFKPDQTS